MCSIYYFLHWFWALSYPNRMRREDGWTGLRRKSGWVNWQEEWTGWRGRFDGWIGWRVNWDGWTRWRRNRGWMNWPKGNWDGWGGWSRKLGPLNWIKEIRMSELSEGNWDGWIEEGGNWDERIRWRKFGEWTSWRRKLGVEAEVLPQSKVSQTPSFPNQSARQVARGKRVGGEEGPSLPPVANKMLSQHYVVWI